MLKYSNATKLTFLILLLAFVNVFAQPPGRGRGEGFGMQGEKARERIEMMKKMKLIEILELDENESREVIQVYDKLDDKIHQAKISVDQAELELEKQMLSDNSDNIKKASEDLMLKMRNMYDAIENKHKGMSEILNQEQFAKYLLFESRFMKRLQSTILNRRRGK